MTDADKKLYDKAVEALDQMGAGLTSEIEKYVPAWIDGYKEGLKAKINATTISDCPVKDKWHKVADGDLPKGNCENILLYNKDHFCVTHSYSLGYYENGVFYNDCEMEEDTIAWCEIPQYEEV